MYSHFYPKVFYFATTQKKIFESGATLIIFKEEINGIIKIVKSFGDSGLLIEGK